MKILILNPRIDAEHGTVKFLKAQGFAVLCVAETGTALQTLRLHGASVDLAVIHRENISGAGEPGLEFLTQLKLDPDQADLPVILTTERWSAQEIERFQGGPLRVSSVLQFPCVDADLWAAVHAIIHPDAPAVPPAQPQTSTNLNALELTLEDSNGPTLEAPYLEGSTPSIRLDPPVEPQMIPTAIHTSVFAPQSSEAPIGIAIEFPAEPEAASTKLIDSSQLESTGSGLELSLQEPPTASISDRTPAVPPPRPIFDAQPETFATAASIPSPAAQARDAIAEQEMPYLFTNRHERRKAVEFALPMGDAVVPGGAAHSPDIETLKKYLLFREQDVAVLSSQLKAAREQIATVEARLSESRALNVELGHITEEQKRRIEAFENESAAAVAGNEEELSEVRFQLKARSDKVRALEMQIRGTSEEIDKLKERVRLDIRKIRVRERELENRLEIMKKDSEALISAREQKIIELKRKLDLAEFNMDLLQDQYLKEKEISAQLRERLAKLAQVVRVAGGMIDATGAPPSGENADRKVS